MPTLGPTLYQKKKIIYCIYTFIHSLLQMKKLTYQFQQQFYEMEHIKTTGHIHRCSTFQTLLQKIKIWKSIFSYEHIWKSIKSSITVKLL